MPLGDIGGDSLPDIAVSAPNDDDGPLASGSVWLLLLNADGTVKSHARINGNTPGVTTPQGDLFGTGLGPLGDITDDGVQDLGVSSPSPTTGFRQGRLWLLSLAGGPIVCGSDVIEPLSTRNVGSAAFGNVMGTEGTINSFSTTDVGLFLNARLDRLGC